MKVLVLKASDDTYEEIKEINSLQDLQNIYHSLVIDFENADDYGYSDINVIVRIYDDYLE
jgi:hypothetical protein